MNVLTLELDQGNFVCSVDLEKAYDHVNWELVILLYMSCVLRSCPSTLFDIYNITYQKEC
jgi:hypothetical protein